MARKPSKAQLNSSIRTLKSAFNDLNRYRRWLEAAGRELECESRRSRSRLRLPRTHLPSPPLRRRCLALSASTWPLIRLAGPTTSSCRTPLPTSTSREDCMTRWRNSAPRSGWTTSASSWAKTSSGPSTAASRSPAHGRRPGDPYGDHRPLLGREGVLRTAQQQGDRHPGALRRVVDRAGGVQPAATAQQRADHQERTIEEIAVLIAQTLVSEAA